MRTLRQKIDVEMKDARVGWRVEGFKNGNPSSKSVTKMLPLKQKVGVEIAEMATLSQKVRQKCLPSCRKWGQLPGRALLRAAAVVPPALKPLSLLLLDLTRQSPINSSALTSARV